MYFSCVICLLRMYSILDGNQLKSLSLNIYLLDCSPSLASINFRKLLENGERYYPYCATSFRYFLALPLCRNQSNLFILRFGAIWFSSTCAGRIGSSIPNRVWWLQPAGFIKIPSWTQNFHIGKLSSGLPWKCSSCLRLTPRQGICSGYCEVIPASNSLGWWIINV